MRCLLLRLKSRSARKAFRHADFMGNCLTVSHKCLLYLPRRWVFLFVPGVAERHEHAGLIQNYLFLFLVLIIWNEEGRWFQDFFCYPRGLRASSWTYRKRGGVTSRVCSVCVWDLTTLAQFQGSEMFPRLFQDCILWIANFRFPFY